MRSGYDLRQIVEHRFERLLMLIVLLVLLLTVGWSVKPLRERGWRWIRAYFANTSADEKV